MTDDDLCDACGEPVSAHDPSCGRHPDRSSDALSGRQVNGVVFRVKEPWPVPPDEPEPSAWTAAWPAAPGWYWFYGVRSRLDQGSRALLPVHVHAAARGGRELVYLSEGMLLERGEGARGVWHRMRLPALPIDER